jgi:hypothetical protein
MTKRSRSNDVIDCNDFLMKMAAAGALFHGLDCTVSAQNEFRVRDVGE